MPKSICSVADCESPTLARGLCNRHYIRWRKHGDPLGGGKSPAVRKSVDVDGLRTCTECGEQLSLDAFDRDKSASGGRRSKCKACRSAQMKSWYADNQERQVQRQRDRYLDHPDRIREQDLQRYERHREKRIELAKAQSYKRRCRLAATDFDKSISTAVLRERDGDLCCYCGVEMGLQGVASAAPTKATIEHVIPLSRGGTHTFDNVKLACRRCNVRKNGRTVEQWGVSVDGGIVGVPQVIVGLGASAGASLRQDRAAHLDASAS